MAVLEWNRNYIPEDVAAGFTPAIKPLFNADVGGDKPRRYIQFNIK